MSYRLMYRFWLDMEKQEEETIADQIEVLKNERSFTSVIRDGIRLVSDLRNGKLDVLFELFPWVRAEFLAYLQDTQSQEGQTQVSDSQQEKDQHIETARQALEAEREALKDERQQQQAMMQIQIERLERMLLQQGNQLFEPVLQQTIAMEVVSGGPTQMIVPEFSAPRFDDEDDIALIEVKMDTDAGQRASRNFINSLIQLQQ